MDIYLGKFPGLYISECEEVYDTNGQLSISTDQPTTVAYQNTVGPEPPTRDTPGSSAGGIVRLPNSVSQGTPFVFFQGWYVLEYFTFTILVFPVIPVIPESPVSGPRPLRVKPILGMVPVTVDVYKVYKVLRTGFSSNLIVFFFSNWPGLIQQSPGLQLSPHVFRLLGDWTFRRMGGLSTAFG